MADRPPRVHGIGGVFFKAQDPEALSAWYSKHLDVGGQPWGGHIFPWKRDDTGASAYSVWSPFKASTEYFKPSDKPYMINLRVDDLDAVLEALRAEGCNVLDRREEDPQQGKFGYVLDPEGGLVELWEQPKE
ncbi:Glyoxalase/Bleomycin resistance protein/Dioxygenase family protein [Lysobacter dokdonensis DS-58]|uniref:Glyoxalase/Bleomycin resistance protein/Dioxygenase family protein n=1 Tax=Lysobacter dokdonensis DS-58 TaxID=1300345 RepID=A0A0A2WKD7_9GAMM|nr:VOC family protein [Lysobacter dokdonensis]KGQ18715.1 Glyoxalase/Bleomycin resistance protein/Dioxygenase family protein [Lysobacter dokdonensis DS-58]